jgi:ABC-type uncharacterized transport system substrate-binding protein
MISNVDPITRGANPGERPVQLPTKYELVINLKTAKALGLTVARSNKRCPKLLKDRLGCHEIQMTAPGILEQRDVIR